MSDTTTLRAIFLPENIQMAYQDQAEAITEAIDILLDVMGADLVNLKLWGSVYGQPDKKLWVEVTDE